jgi:hypothetical protein
MDGTSQLYGLGFVHGTLLGEGVNISEPVREVMDQVPELIQWFRNAITLLQFIRFPPSRMQR